MLGYTYVMCPLLVIDDRMVDFLKRSVGLCCVVKRMSLGWVLCVQETEVFSLRRTDSSRIMLTIAYTNEIMPTAPNCLQLYNIIFKRWLVNIVSIVTSY